jgi:peptidoglycan hydrolase CwlO-like protein
MSPDGNEDDQLSVGEAHLWIDRTDTHIADLETKIKSFEKQVADMNRTLANIQACRKEVKGFLDKIKKLAK